MSNINWDSPMKVAPEENYNLLVDELIEKKLSADECPDEDEDEETYNDDIEDEQEYDKFGNRTYTQKDEDGLDDE